MTGRLAPSTRRERAAVPPGWRSRLPAALPLFLVGAFSFAVSFLAFRMIVEGPGHLPVWSLFTATGAILCAGGAAVVVAGGEGPDEESPFFDAERFVLVPRTEYEELRSRSPPPPRAAQRAGSPSPTMPVPTVPAGASRSADRSWDEGPGGVEAPARIRSAGDLDKALREVESVLASLTESPPPNAPTPEAPRPVAPAGSPRSRTARVPPSTGLAAAAPSAARRAPDVVAAAGVCTSCGARIENALSARHCSACDEPMCVACAARADWEGHAELCPRCHGLLVLSHAKEDLPGRGV